MITSSYYRGAHGIVIVYDVTHRTSFEQVSVWIKQINEFAPKNVCKLLVGNKVDLVEKRKEGMELAAKLGIGFIETSAKVDERVSDVFTTMTQMVNERTKEDPTIGSTEKIQLNKVEVTEIKKKKKCLCK
ncbi:Ras family protein [Reticulomyxa filosa]|uniref:Ras family protein n=1 Tax=Reticulomyxa filosa TaxID=46433 RepID=X6MBE2_RETFI|nr:Ras family protein [Reticulomyxa filosa]|eukprot:ETO11184.1 Ras family protein [Reticulomyxa filosa]